ncbi:MAG: hypothetical protein JWM65_3258 [Sphingomonas bacterium]|nr:hypothetical protein [Sphingomonas bacterium]
MLGGSVRRLLPIMAVFAAPGAFAADHPIAGLKIGALDLGMTLAEAKAALPNATQEDSGPVEAPSALDLAGMRMDVSYARRADGRMRVELTTHWPVQPQECMARLDAVVGVLEPIFGSFRPDEVRGYTIRPAGARSKMGWFLSRGFGGGQDGLVQASAFIRGPEQPITVNAQANERRNLEPDADGRLECELFVYLDYRLKEGER